jgi:hypothetical protein
MGGAEAAVSSEQMAFFENEVRPLLASECLECHSRAKGKVKGGFSMDNRAEMLLGGETGVALVPGNPSESSLIRAVRREGDLQMPPKKKLNAAQIATLTRWVQMGAPDPRDGVVSEKDSRRDHWAFQPLSRPIPPAVKNQAWCRNSIDKFVLAKLEERGMVPAGLPESGDAEERTFKKQALLRRAYFDLIGVPPSPEQIRGFVADSSPDAFEKVVDQLLASPAYGERWARHWMDTARYSDTTGNIAMEAIEGDDYRFPYAWTYRDWLITALNRDMPYDEFVRHQLAADKLPGNDKENLAALGFLTVGQRFRDGNEVINDRIDAIGRGFLGLTVACARCHDHKFDPITQADYYALHGVLKSTTEPLEGPVIREKPADSKEVQEYQKSYQALIERARTAVIDMQTEFSARFRANPAAYFAVACLSHRKWSADPWCTQKSQEIFSQNLKGNDAFFVPGRIGSQLLGPVLGPFTELIENPGRIAPKQSVKNRNPMVEDYLRRAGPLPTDVEGVAALLEKFLRQEVGPRLTPELYAKIRDPKSHEPEAPIRPLLELAVFPLKLMDISAIVSVSDVRRVSKQIHASAGDLGENYDTRAGLSKMNELMMTSKGAPVRAMALEDLPEPKDSPIFPRGNMPKPGDRVRMVPRRFIEALSGGGAPPAFTQGSGRLELAEAIVHPRNPLTARVAVNRIWMHHFGEGLVTTPDDLGLQAGAPSHPELLDFLSSWFMQDYGPSKPAWSMKSLHKAIMLSSTYQQSSRTVHLQRQAEMDPANTLLWRSNVRRLDFEAFRDSLLRISGVLNPTMYGAPVNLVSEPYSFRRTLYGYVDRLDVPDLLMQFDMASPLQTNSKRANTIVPQQALFLLNSPFVLQIVQKTSQRQEILNAVLGHADPRVGIVAVFEVVLQRIPTRVETAAALEFLRTEASKQKEISRETEVLAATANKIAAQTVKHNVSRLDSRSNVARRAALVNEGELVQRVALTPWEALIQALMFTNEAIYLH